MEKKKKKTFICAVSHIGFTENEEADHVANLATTRDYVHCDVHSVRQILFESVYREI